MLLLDEIWNSVTSKLTENGYSFIPTTNESILNLVSDINKPDIISHDLVNIYNVTDERRGLITPIRFQTMDDLQSHVNNLLVLLPAILSPYPDMKCFFFVSGVHYDHPTREDMLFLILKGLVGELEIRYDSQRITWDFNSALTQEDPILNVLISYPDDESPIDWDYIAHELYAKEMQDLLKGFELTLD